MRDTRGAASNARSQSMLAGAMDMFVDTGTDTANTANASNAASGRTQAEIMQDLMGRK